MILHVIQENNRSELDRFDRERQADFLSMLKGFVTNQVLIIVSIGQSSFIIHALYDCMKWFLNPIHQVWRLTHPETETMLWNILEMHILPSFWPFFNNENNYFYWEKKEKEKGKVKEYMDIEKNKSTTPTMRNTAYKIVTKCLKIQTWRNMIRMRDQTSKLPRAYSSVILTCAEAWFC